jgi:hypothetical protein
LRFTVGDLRRRENADWIPAVVSRSYVKGSVKWVARAEKAASVRGVEIEATRSVISLRANSSIFAATAPEYSLIERFVVLRALTFVERTQAWK